MENKGYFNTSWVLLPNFREILKEFFIVGGATGFVAVLVDGGNQKGLCN